MSASIKHPGGIIVPLVTPLLGQDTLDVESLKRMIDHVIQGQVDGIFILGTTGESPSLSCSLRKQMIEQTCDWTNHRLPVLVGLLETSVAQATHTAQIAAQNGADYVVPGAPFYFPISQNQLFEYTKELASKISLPLYLYNKPDCMKNVFEIETLKKLIAVENIVGIKDSGGDMSYFSRLLELKKFRPDWLVLMGIEQMLAQAVGRGADGAVTGGANLLPRLFVDLHHAVREKTSDLEPLQKKVMDLSLNLYQPDYLAGLKYAMSRKKLCSELTALPLGAAGPEQKKRIDHYLQSLPYR